MHSLVPPNIELFWLNSKIRRGSTKIFSSWEFFDFSPWEMELILLNTKKIQESKYV